MHLNRSSLSFLVVLLCWLGSVYGQTAQELKPLRVGPVSAYGALGTSGKNIVSIKSGKTVQLRGMSLFWSSGIAVDYYSNTTVNWLAQDMKVDVVRAAVAVKCYTKDACTTTSGTNYLADGYLATPDIQKARVDAVVRAAILNDIYVIIDWHTHRGLDAPEQAAALTFFAEMALLYKDIPNVIFEVFNEPVSDTWPNIKAYAETVVPKIRLNSPNLVLVGTPSYSSILSSVSSNPVKGDNIAYVFHFYASSHPLSSFQTALEAVTKPIFVSEWGTTDYGGKVWSTSNSATNSNAWLAWMDLNKISHCNWSVRHSNSEEYSAIFDATSSVGSTMADMRAATLTASGSLMKTYLAGKARNWSDTLVLATNSGTVNAGTLFVNTTVNQSVTELDILGAGPTYTSSNTDVAEVSNGKLVIKGVGYAVITATSGAATKSIVVTVTALDPQTLSIRQISCYLNNSCNTGSKLVSNVYTLPRTTTIQGSLVTYTSSDLTVATTSSNKITAVKFGTVTIRATAPAITGYAPYDTFFTFSYSRVPQTLSLSNKTVDLSAGVLEYFKVDATIEGQPITYLITSEPAGIATRNGLNLVFTAAGVVTIKATAPGTDYYDDLERNTTITITDATPVLSAQLHRGLDIQAARGGVLLAMPREGSALIRVLDINGRQVGVQTVDFKGQDVRFVSLSALSRGLYMVSVKQGSSQKTIRYYHSEGK